MSDNASATGSTSVTREPTVWTRRLQLLTFAVAIVCTIGTALHNFAIINTGMIEQMMRQAGETDPAAAAASFTTGFQIVGTAYIIGNALGILALWSRATWLFWVVLAVNATQGLGAFMIPPEMWTVGVDRYGIVGILPSAITDGLGALIAICLAVSLVRFRTPWAQQRTHQG